jgi:hypothetical protein
MLEQGIAKILPGTGRWQHEVLTEGVRHTRITPSTSFAGPPPRAGEEW